MFANDPTLYGATLPHRDFNFMNPYFNQWQKPQIPWTPYGRFVPPMMQPEYLPQVPPFFGTEVPPIYGTEAPAFYGNRYIPQTPFLPTVPFAQTPYLPTMPFAQKPYLPFMQGIQNLPFKWQVPFVY